MEIIQLGKYSVKVLDPKILVFQNVLSDPDGLVDFYENNVEWGGWYGFGKQSIEDGDKISTDNFPTKEEWEHTFLGKTSNPYRDEVYNIFYETSKLYTEHTGTKLNSWYTENWSVARYTPDVDHINNEERSMGYHTDYQQDRYGQPGNKFTITSVLYPNEGYGGGEISFRVLKPKSFTVDREITYKPNKGDMIFFPSTDPYYHGVLRIWDNPKYIIRLYWLSGDDGTEEWHALRKKYGNEQFEQMEKARLKRYDLSMYEPVQRPLLTFKEYYEMLENGSLPPFIEGSESDELIALRARKLSEEYEPYEQ